MKLRVAVAVIAVASFVSACSSTSDGYVNANGSVATSRDDALVYAVDTDSNSLFVIDAASQKVLAQVGVGTMPEKVLVTADDTIYVTNRLSRSVSVVRKGDWREAAQLHVGVEPVGLAASADGKTLYVVNATRLDTAETGSLMAIDTQTQATKWEVSVGPEPRGLALLANGRAMVSLLKEGDIAVVDLEKQSVVRSGSQVNSQLNDTSKSFGGAQADGAPAPLPNDVAFGINSVHTRGMGSLAVSPDGHQVYAATLLSSDATLVGDMGSGVNPQTNAAGASSAGYGGGSCGATAVSSPSVISFTETGDSQAHSVTDCSGTVDPSVPALVLSSGDSSRPVQGPVAIAADPTGSFLYVVNQQSNNVAVIPTSQRQTAQQSSDFTKVDAVPGAFGAGTVRALVDVGAGPTGIALTRDGNKAYVYNSFDHSLSIIERKDGMLQTTSTVAITGETLTPDQAAGRRLFFSAVDSRMNNPGTGISCATCHTESREDGHVWNFTDGPRQTPSLAGRMIDQTAPYHWSGVFPSLGDFMTHTVAQRMGGTGFTPQMADQIGAYLKVIPAPDNPNRHDQLTEQQLRGAQVFAAAGCNACHDGAPMTDNGFHDVGTFVPDLGTGNVHDDITGTLVKGLNTPSLLGLARSAPYLHTGAALTIKDRILHDQQANNDLHGSVSHLTGQQVDDLVAYLSQL